MDNPSSKKIKILAIVIAVITILVAFFVYPQSNYNVKINNVKLGPEIIINNTNNTNNNTSIRIELFSVNPEIFYEHNVKDQEYLLFNSTINKNQSYYMSPLFFSIVNEWKHLFNNYKGINKPSLIMEAFKTVENNNKTYVYNYYNNILFNPYNISTENILTDNNTLLKNYNINNNSNYYNITFSKNTFKINTNFNDKPVNIINNNMTQNNTVKPYISYQPYTCYTKYYYTYPTNSNTYTENTGVNTTRGVLPLGIIHFGKNTGNSKSEITVGSSVIFINATINLNSNQVSINSNGEVSTTMSSEPFYAHIANASIKGYGAGYAAFPLGSNNEAISAQLNRTTAYVGIQNATYTFTHYKTYTNTKKYKDYWEQKYRYIPGEGYTYFPPRLISSTLISDKTILDSKYTVGGISYINTINNIQMKTGFLPIAFTYVLQNLSMINKNYSENLTLNYTGNNTTLNAVDFYSHINGYISTTQALKNAEHALQIFSSGIAVGIALMDVLSSLNVFGDSSMPEIVADSLSLISSTLSLSADVLSLFNSVGSITNTDSAIVTTFIDNVPLGATGSNYSIQMYSTQNPINVDINNNNYNFYAPIDYFNATKVTF